MLKIKGEENAPPDKDLKMAKQMNLYSRPEMVKAMRRDREDFAAGELLKSKRFQARALAKRGYSINLIAKLLKLSHNVVTKYLIET